MEEHSCAFGSEQWSSARPRSCWPRAVGLLGAWAMGVGLTLVVGTSVATAIVWEERDAALEPAERGRTDELAGAPAAGR